MREKHYVRLVNSNHISRLIIALSCHAKARKDQFATENAESSDKICWITVECSKKNLEYYRAVVDGATSILNTLDVEKTSTGVK